MWAEGSWVTVVRINVKCNRQFMTDEAEGGSNSDTITPQEVDQEDGARRWGGSEEGPWSLRLAVGR